MFTNHGPTAAGPSRIARSIPTPSGLSAAVAVGAQWWVCRSAHAAMWAPSERWRQPRLAPWEIPRPDPAEPRPNAPEVTAQRRAARLARQRARNATQHPTARPHAGMQTVAQESADQSGAVLIKSRPGT